MSKILVPAIILLLCGIAMEFIFLEEVPDYIAAMIIGLGIGAGVAISFHSLRVH